MYFFSIFQGAFDSFYMIGKDKQGETAHVALVKLFVDDIKGD